MIINDLGKFLCKIIENCESSWEKNIAETVSFRIKMSCIKTKISSCWVKIFNWNFTWCIFEYHVWLTYIFIEKCFTIQKLLRYTSSDNMAVCVLSRYFQNQFSLERANFFILSYLIRTLLAFSNNHEYISMNFHGKIVKSAEITEENCMMRIFITWYGHCLWPCW